MDFKAKRVLILGGTGLVGRAIAERALKAGAARVAVLGLYQSEAEETLQLMGRGRLVSESLNGIKYLRRGRLLAFWGNMFVRTSFKDMSRKDLLSKDKARRTLIKDTYYQLNEEILNSSFLYQLITGFKPHAVYDSVNTATALAYQNVYDAGLDLFDRIQNEDKELGIAAEKMLLTTYVPQLVRHMQILRKALKDADCEMYLKIGTTGTGGMGWDIPYTHSEDRPSRVLLSKTAMAGAQSMLMLIMSRASDAPVVKELKPAAAIAWQGIGIGEIRKHGMPIPVYDNQNPVPLKKDKSFSDIAKNIKVIETGENLNSVFIDTGENGLFSKGEFVALTSLNQMEFITPEEIADYAVLETVGANTGRDVVDALEAAVMGPTYRAGYLREAALKRLDAMERKNKAFPSVAFEILGPPRLSKLLFEAHILLSLYKDMRVVVKKSPDQISKDISEFVLKNSTIRMEALSVGVPVLMPDMKLLAGKSIKIPLERERNLPATPENIERWAYAGWIDTRPSNAAQWIDRFKRIIEDAESRSRRLRGGYMAASSEDRRFIKPDTLGVNYRINPGEIIAWVFINEEHGKRTRR